MGNIGISTVQFENPVREEVEEQEPYEAAPLQCNFFVRIKGFPLN